MAPGRERVLITGGNGFLGASLTRELLAAGHDVHLLLRPGAALQRLADVQERLTAHQGDLLDGAALRRAAAACRPDVVYHLAAQGVSPKQQDRAALLAANVVGLANLLDALRGHDYRAFVHAGTCVEYGPREGRIHEDETLDPRTPYAVAKAAASLVCRAEARHGRPVRIVRIFSAYGPGEASGRLIPQLLRGCLHGAALRLSAGLQVRDFIHAADVVALLRAAADAPLTPGQVLHAGTGLGHSVRDVVEVVRATAGGRLRVEFGAVPLRPDEPPVCVAGTDATQRLTGWRPRLDLRGGIELTWAAFRATAHAAA